MRIPGENQINQADIDVIYREDAKKLRSKQTPEAFKRLKTAIEKIHTQAQIIRATWQDANNLEAEHDCGNILITPYNLCNWIKVNQNGYDL